MRFGIIIRLFLSSIRHYIRRKCEVPEEPYECDYCCDIKKEGTDITFVAYSSMVDQSLKAAAELEKEWNQRRGGRYSFTGTI